MSFIWSVAFGILSFLVTIAVLLSIPLPRFIKKPMAQFAYRLTPILFLLALGFGFSAYQSYKDFTGKYSINNLPPNTMPETRYSIESKYFRNQRNFYIDIFAVVIAFLVQRLAAITNAFYFATESSRVSTTTATTSTSRVVDASSVSSKKDE